MVLNGMINFVLSRAMMWYGITRFVASFGMNRFVVSYAVAWCGMAKFVLSKVEFMV